MSEAAILTDVAVSFYNSPFDKTGVASNLCEIMDGIKAGKWKERVDKVRNENDKKTRDTLKQNVPAFTPSGLFSERKESGLVSHSNRLAVDFDLKDNVALQTRLEAVREALQGDKYSEYVSLSASGQGLFVIVRIDGDRHAESFAFLERYYKETYGLTIDKSCKDVSRLRFVSYDPNLFHNPKSQVVTVPDVEVQAMGEYPKDENHNNSGNAQIMAEIIKAGKLIGDDSYADWLKIGLALANEFGESGRQCFHVLSGRSSKYDSTECDKKYDNCLRTNRGEVAFATIVHMAKVAGIELGKTKRQVKSEEIGNVFDNERSQVKAFNLTDLGNAKRLVSLYGDKIRYCFAWKKWLVWDGKTWSIDDNGQIITGCPRIWSINN